MEIPNVNEAIKVVTDRMKVPIISIYVIVSILYNWDKILLIIFHDQNMLWKIEHIQKQTPLWSYVLGVIICLVISVVVLFLFAFLNTWCTSKLVGLYRKDKNNLELLEKSALVEENNELKQRINDLTLVNKQQQKEINILKAISPYDKVLAEIDGDPELQISNEELLKEVSRIDNYEDIIYLDKLLAKTKSESSMYKLLGIYEKYLIIIKHEVNYNNKKTITFKVNLNATLQ